MSESPNDGNGLGAGRARPLETGITTGQTPPQAKRTAWTLAEKRRLLWLAPAAVLFGALFWWWAEFHGIHQSSLTPWRAERMVAADLPNGSTREQVEAWLDAHSIQHGRSGPFYAIQLNNIYAKLKTLPIDSEVQAEIPDANVSLVFPGRLVLYFFFDKDGKLLMHIVRGENDLDTWMP